MVDKTEGNKKVTEGNFTDMETPKDGDGVSVAVSSGSAPSSGFLSRLKKMRIGKGVFAGIGILVSALVVGGGIYAYNNIYLAPEKVLARSLDKLKEVKSLEFSGKASLTLSSDEAGGSLLPLFSANVFTVNMDGQIDVREESNEKSEISLEIKNGVNSFGKFKLRGIGEKAYLFIEDLSGLETLIFGATGQGTLKPLTNQWVRLPDEEELKKLGYPSAKQPEIDPTEFSRLLEENNPFKIISQLPDQEIDGQNMFHYGFELDKEKFKTLIIKYQELMSKSSSSQESSLGPLARENIQKGLDKLELKGGEIWMGKKDNLPHKVTFGIQEKSEKSSFGVDITWNMRNYGKEVKIEEPQDARSFEEFLGGLQLFRPQNLLY